MPVRTLSVRPGLVPTISACFAIALAMAGPSGFDVEIGFGTLDAVVSLALALAARSLFAVISATNVWLVASALR